MRRHIKVIIKCSTCGQEFHIDEINFAIFQEREDWELKVDAYAHKCD